MIVVKLTKSRATEHYPEHVRVAIHEPKERDRLDMAIVNSKSGFLHVASDVVPFREWLTANYIFQRQDPAKYYRLGLDCIAPVMLEDSDSTDGKTEPKSITHFDLTIPQDTARPKVTTYLLGSYKFEGSDNDEIVVGFMTENVHAHYHNEHRHETVCYMLNTCRSLVEEGFLHHLHEQLTNYGFTTLYKGPAVKE